ncbi:MAG: tRNA uridine-5-carboxymethylaminomethyl(34) synthesis enzyme MnmG [Vampirovibrionia bacterium]
MTDKNYDVLVVGAGHAGCEAAIAAARLGCKTMLATINLDTVGMMPCNPAIGGPAKSNLVREVDAMGGIIGELADDTYLQLKMLNKSKGPAVWALRAQTDKIEYIHKMRKLLEAQENLDIKQAMITELITGSNDEIIGAKDYWGIKYNCKAVILTTGTFLNGRIFIGLKSFPAGRAGEFPATGLSEDLMRLGFTVKKLKTGTPARVDGRTLDYTKMSIQPGDDVPEFFSFAPDRPIREQFPCYLTKTTLETHRIIKSNLDKSPLYKGLIGGVGPRYCPSIEDKVVRFSDRDSHLLFVEPESKGSYEIYVQGFSTSLPADVQIQMLRSLPGFDKVEVLRPAYAVDYDYLPAIQLDHTLMTKRISGLFGAGQINGTSGYEEAAAQGLVAGINASRLLSNKPLIKLERASSYIGTLIDDLVTKNIEEPYRMLTSRSEYRLLLRQDNADVRLSPLGKEIGLLSEERWKHFQNKLKLIDIETQRIKETKIKANEETNSKLEKYNEHLQSTSAIHELLKRPSITYETLKEVDNSFNYDELDKEISSAVEISIKYSGYIQRQKEQVNLADRLEKINIPESFDYNEIKQISNESKERLNKVRPTTLGQASRIGGVTPADISILMVIIEARRRAKIK